MLISSTTSVGGRGRTSFGELAYRYSASNSIGNLTASFVPADLTTQLFSSFVQDEIAIIPNRLFLTIGTKLEHNYYTGFDFMPSIRVAWAPSPHHTLWAAVSKADRTPSELDASIRATLSGFPGPGGIPCLVTFIGNPAVKNEGLIAYEMGYRTTVLKQLSIDFTAYYNNYSNQETGRAIDAISWRTRQHRRILSCQSLTRISCTEKHTDSRSR